jgi:hypothetical protein
VLSRNGQVLLRGGYEEHTYPGLALWWEGPSGTRLAYHLTNRPIDWLLDHKVTAEEVALWGDHEFVRFAFATMGVASPPSDQVIRFRRMSEWRRPTLR